MLNKELSHFSESSHSGNQISEYLCNTFLGEPAEKVIGGNIIFWEILDNVNIFNSRI